MSHERPVIGITAYEEEASWGVRECELAAIVPADYIRSVLAAGGVAVLLPVQPDNVDDLLDRIDGVVVTGGPDVDPARYGAAPHPETQEPRRDRDRFELAILDEAERRDMPLLAICRGLQALNVSRGGTLHQHIPDLVDEDHGGGGVFANRSVRIDPDSRLASVLGGASAPASCHHHQSVDILGDGLVPVAWAGDGTVEAVEDPARPFLLAVQWHPEVGEDLALFESLVDAAASRGRRQLPASASAARAL